MAIARCFSLLVALLVVVCVLSTRTRQSISILFNTSHEITPSISPDQLSSVQCCLCGQFAEELELDPLFHAFEIVNIYSK